MTKADLAQLVTEGAKLDRLVKRLKPKSERLDAIKEILRVEAKGKDAKFEGVRDGEIPPFIAEVKQIADGVPRSVDPKLLGKVRRLCGKALASLFKLAPVKDFKLEACKALPPERSGKLLELLTCESTPRVSFA